MSIIIGLLYVILVITCLFLALLILVQLPRKDAGAGMAFGGSAGEAIFGAGSGNVLTKLTKYSATIFIGLSLLLAIIVSHRADRQANVIEEGLTQESTTQSNAPSTTIDLPAEEVAVPKIAEETPLEIPGVTNPAEGTNNTSSSTNTAAPQSQTTTNPPSSPPLQSQPPTESPTPTPEPTP